MRPIEFGENVPPGTRLILFPDIKPDQLFTVLEFKLDPQVGSLAGLGCAIPTYRVQDEEGRIHLLINEPDEEEWWLWRPDQAAAGPKSVFDGALVDD
jgi:hypothetical protein